MSTFSKYLNLLPSFISGQHISMTSQIPSGNVYLGLAWAFHVNYLNHVLPGMLKYFKSCTCNNQSHINHIICFILDNNKIIGELLVCNHTDLLLPFLIKNRPCT